MYIVTFATLSQISHHWGTPCEYDQNYARRQASTHPLDTSTDKDLFKKYIVSINYKLPQVNVKYFSKFK